MGYMYMYVAFAFVVKIVNIQFHRVIYMYLDHLKERIHSIYSE